jgi:hypothetical protein
MHTDDENAGVSASEQTHLSRHLIVLVLYRTYQYIVPTDDHNLQNISLPFDHICPVNRIIEISLIVNKGCYWHYYSGILVVDCHISTFASIGPPTPDRNAAPGRRGARTGWLNKLKKLFNKGPPLGDRSMEESALRLRWPSIHCIELFEEWHRTVVGGFAEIKDSNVILLSYNEVDRHTELN